jgi:hypothetical protein
MTSKQGQCIPAEVGGTLSSAAAAMYELVESHSEKRATDAAALRHAPIGDANARRPAPNPPGCPAWARSRHPRDSAWKQRVAYGRWLRPDDLVVRRSSPRRRHGLLWRLCGGKITGMHADWAMIEVNGQQQVVHRRPAPASCCRGAGRLGTKSRAVARYAAINAICVKIVKCFVDESALGLATRDPASRISGPQSDRWTAHLSLVVR